MDGGAWWAAVLGVAKSRAQLSNFPFTYHFSLSCIGEGNGNPLQCYCLEESQGRGSLVGCRLWGRTESDTTEVTWQQQHIGRREEGSGWGTRVDLWWIHVDI